MKISTIIKYAYALALLPFAPIVIIIGYLFNPVDTDTFGDVVEDVFSVWNKEYWK